MKKILVVLFFAVYSLASVNVLSAQIGRLLKVWSCTPEIDEIFHNYFKKDNRIIQIDHSYTPFEQYENRLDSALSSRNGVPDVFTMESWFVRKYVESGMLMDLTDIYEENKTKLLMYPVHVGVYNGRVYAFAWQANPGAMFYRRSLAKKYLGTDDPQVVQTYFSDFEKMMETAALLKNRSDGSCVLTASGAELFIPFLYSRRSFWVMNGQLVIDPAMEEYMDVRKTLYEKQMEGRVDQWSQDWLRGMRDEMRDMNENQIEVFSYFLPTWGLHYVLKTNTTREDLYSTSGDWAMIEGPVPYSWGGTWIAVNNYSENASAAKALIRYLATNESFQERYARDTGEYVTSLSAIQKVKNSFSEPFLGGQNHYALFDEIAAKVDGRLLQATDQRIQDIFSEQVDAYMLGQKTKARALDDFREKIRKEFGDWYIGH